MADIAFIKGDRFPVISDVLVDADGNPQDLTGFEIQLGYQNLRTGRVRTVDVDIISPATDGAIQYEPDEDDAVDVGDCIGNWIVDRGGGRKETLPSFEFSIRLGASDPMPIAAYRPFIRTLLGDNHPTIKQYHADQLDDAVRLVVNLGKVPQVKLTSDGMGLDPALSPNSDDPVVAKNWCRVVLWAAKQFAMPNVSAYSFRTRALSESFGAQSEMIFDLLNEVYDLEAGEGVF